MGDKKWDQRDSQKWSKDQYGEEESNGSVRRTWHQARSDCQRSNDDYDKKMSKDWERKDD